MHLMIVKTMRFVRTCVEINEDLNQDDCLEYDVDELDPFSDEDMY